MKGLDTHRTIEELALEIDTGMEFRFLGTGTSQENADETHQGIDVDGIIYRKGSRFELQRRLRLAKEESWECIKMTVQSWQEVAFFEDDIVSIQEVREWGTPIIVFTVKGKNRKSAIWDNDSKTQLSLSVDDFRDIFETYADIEIAYLNAFRFKQDDVIVIDEILEWHYLRENGETGRARNQVVFHIRREWEDVLDWQGHILKFKFNAEIFLERFQKHTDIEDVIKKIKQRVKLAV